jgi:hypothetical protein
VFVALIVCDPDTIRGERTPLYEALAKLNRALQQGQKTPQASPKRPRTPQDKAPRRQNDPDPFSGGRSSYIGQMAERAGFEPAMEFNPHTRLAGECLQPLGHLSWRSSHQCKAWDRRAVRLEVGPCRTRVRACRRSIWSRPRRGLLGRVAERLNAAVLKTVDGGNVVRGFESPPFRFRVCVPQPYAVTSAKRSSPSSGTGSHGAA